jgi:hypothetical protein
MNLLSPLASGGRSLRLQLREESLRHQVCGGNLRIHTSEAHSRHHIGRGELGP